MAFILARQMYEEHFRCQLLVLLALLALVTAAHADIGHNQIAEEPNWLTGDTGKYTPRALTDHIQTLVLSSKTGSSAGESGSHVTDGVSLQQSDILKPVLLDIAKNGLAHAYKKFKGDVFSDLSPEPEQTRKPKNVVIVGAGMAGLVAAHELVRVGHDVTIVEMQERIGGRVKTISGDGGGREKRTHYQHGEFEAGLYVDGKYFLSG